MVENIKKCLNCNKSFSVNNTNRKKQYCNIECTRQAIYKRKKKIYKSNLNNWRKNNIKLFLENDRKYKQNHKTQINAVNSVYRLKKIKPELFPKECCICGNTENIEYHHPCYDFSLSVYPLCKKHHLEIHNKTEVIM